MIVMTVLLTGLLVRAVGSTIAYFNDTEKSTGNNLTAGTLDLKVGGDCSYNGQKVDACSWETTDLKGQLFFNYQDVKPGDEGENTLALELKDNPAWICAEIKDLKTAENGCKSSEQKQDSTCDNPGNGQGELQKYLTFDLWRDYDCGNDFDGDDYYIIQEAKLPLADGVWPIADKTTGQGPIPSQTKTCLALSWNLAKETSNIIQGDSLAGNIQFNAFQARHNDDFKCETTGGGGNGTSSTSTGPIIKAIFEMDADALEN